MRKLWEFGNRGLAANCPLAPHLRVAGLEARQLQELALLVFLHSCSLPPSPALLQSLRSQLEINEGRGGEIQQLAQMALQHGIPSLALLDSHLQLLQLAQASHFRTFASYVSWRDTTAALVWGVLSHAAQSGQQRAPPPSSSSSIRTLLARLKGALRRMDARDPTEFDDREHASAAAAVTAAAEALAVRCHLDLQLPLPWELRVQLAEHLLLGVFDPLDAGTCSTEAPELLSLLQGAVWSQLGISQRAHHVLIAWVHLRQYVDARNPGLLAGAQAAVQSVAAAAVAAGGWPGVPADFADVVLDRLRAELIGLLEDYHSLVPEPGHMKVRACRFLGSEAGGWVGAVAFRAGACMDLFLHHSAIQSQPLFLPMLEQAVLDLLDKVQQARGCTSPLASLLERCVASSVRSAFEREPSDSTSNPTEEKGLEVLSARAQELLRSEVAQYGPALQQYLPQTVAVAASTLHGLYGTKVLPWLTRGVPLHCKPAIPLLMWASALP